MPLVAAADLLLCETIDSSKSSSKTRSNVSDELSMLRPDREDLETRVTKPLSTTTCWSTRIGAFVLRSVFGEGQARPWPPRLP
jgi:hypothetical protein